MHGFVCGSLLSNVSMCFSPGKDIGSIEKERKKKKKKDGTAMILLMLLLMILFIIIQ